MEHQLDLRDETEQSRQRIFDALDSVDTGEELEVVAAEDIDTHLVRFQFQHDREVAWEYADPSAEPRELTVRKGDTFDQETVPSIDVRDLKPQRRHEVLLSIVEELEPGETFVLINDHDPRPLYYELTSMHGDVIEWGYRTEGSDRWAVEVERTDRSTVEDREVTTRFDVRQIPKHERHPVLHHRFGMIPEGGTMELIASHEPRPLHQEFRQRYGESFTWDIKENEPGRCRVWITKTETHDEEPDDAGHETAHGDASTDGSLDVVDELDVRELPPAQRHRLIFEAYEQLDRGDGFVLVNDHDPKPLYHQFEAEAGPEFRWEYRQREPGEFRVLIGRGEQLRADSPDESSGGPPF
ncbi:MAG: DUF2249 domain-containing protein [Halodesulfurarchaeum sp.]